MDFYIHQIGDINNEKTYKRLTDILKSKMICSRDFLEKIGVNYSYDNQSFKLDIPKDENGVYYEGDIHKDRVSLSDPRNKFVSKSIELKMHKDYTCFDYDYIAFAISRDVPILKASETRGLALGEVQVKDKIGFEYVTGLIIPSLPEKSNNELVEVITNICEQNDTPLDIYNYEGELIYKASKKIK